MTLPFYNQPFPIIDLDDKYILREQTLEDTEEFFNYYTVPEVGQYILASKPSSLLDASSELQYCRNLFYTKKGIYWTLATKSDNKMIGAIGLYVNNIHKRGEITYDLAKPFWRQGIMLKVLTAIIKHAFNEMGLERIEAVTRIDNEPSINILKKLHFTHEGTLRKYRYFNKKNWDIEMFGLTKEDAEKL